MPKSDQFTELYAAAKELLANAIDLGDVYVNGERYDIDEYPQDDDGEHWYHDWWDLKCAVEACDKLLED